MPLSTGSAILAVCLLIIGLISVQMEVQNVHCGVRVRDLLREREQKVEILRKLDMEYNTQIAPDSLERDLPDDYRTEEGYPDNGRSAAGKKPGGERVSRTR